MAGKKILVVDDSRTMLDVLSISLRGAGHEVKGVNDALSALKFATQNLYDLVITDIHMPNMDGIEFVKKLRSLKQYQFLPILALTTDATPQMKSHGREAGITGWIVKPFDYEKLIIIIDKLAA